MPTNTAALPPLLAVAEKSPTSEYRTYWHYRYRATAGLFVRYEEPRTATFCIDVSGGDPTEAYAKATSLADQQFRGDARRLGAVAEFDGIEPISDELRKIYGRNSFIILSVKLAAFGLMAWLLWFMVQSVEKGLSH